MKLRVLFALLFLTFTAAVTTIPCDADAARMGGGRSFGSQPAMRAPAARPQNPGYAPGAMTAPQQRQSIPQAAPRAVRASLAASAAACLAAFSPVPSSAPSSGATVRAWVPAHPA